MNDKCTFNNETNELSAKGDEYVPYSGGLGKFCFDKLKLYAADKDLVAQIDVATNTHQSYQEFLQRCLKLAQYFRDVGINAGDRIALCSYNHLDAAVVEIATLFVGAILSPTDPILTRDDTKYLLDMVKPKIVFVSDGSEELIAELGLPAKLITFADSTKYESFERIINDANYCGDFKPYLVDDLDATAIILFSSGTTGMPKGIQLSHNFFLSQIETLISLTSNAYRVYLNYASLYWISAVYCTLASILSGSPRVLCKAFNPKTHWAMVEKYKVSVIFLSYTYTAEAVDELTENMKLPDLDVIIIAGGRVAENVIQAYNRKLPHIKIGPVYALTEAGLISKFQNDSNISSTGKPISNNQIIKIVDPENERTLPLNNVGEVRVKRKYQMTGYYNKDSSDAWDAEGFLKTGDLGYINDAYDVFIVDRIKEMFKYRSWHVVPAKIEKVLDNIPEVMHAIVIGKPTWDGDENHTMALVCLRPGATVQSAEDIERIANQRLGDIDKIRAGIHIVDYADFSFTPSGKINRRVMKEFAMRF